MTAASRNNIMPVGALRSRGGSWRVRAWFVFAIAMLASSAGRSVHAQPPALDSPPQAAPQDPVDVHEGAHDGAVMPDAGQEAATAAGAPVTVTTRLSPDPSHVGDILELLVTVAHPVGFSVNLPTGLRFGALHLVGVDEGPVESTGQALRKTFTIRLQAFQLERTRIPAFAITYVDTQGGVHTLDVPAKTFTVERLLANEAAATRRGEDPPVSLEYPAQTAETVIYSLLLGAVLAALLTLAWMRHRAATRVPLPIPVEPPHERARRNLTALRARLDDLFGGRMEVLYYLELTEIAKHYLQGRFGVDTLDRTTDEIRQVLVSHAREIEPLSVAEVIEFLSACDLVKFARYEPTIETGRRDHDLVVAMVERVEAARREQARKQAVETAAKPAPVESERPSP